MEPSKTEEVRDSIMGKDQLPLVLQAYHIPAHGEGEFYAVDMLNRILSGGESSRLNKALVEEQQLALCAGAFSFPLEAPGLTLAFSMANMGVEARTVEAAMNAEIDKVKN